MNQKLLFAAIIVASVTFRQPALAQQACEKLKDLHLPGVEITSAAAVPEGQLTTASNAQPVVVPARCAVHAIARPTSDSEIGIEIWLPAAGWNGKYEQVGNGGWGGALPLTSMVGPLRRGYATAATDDGHKGIDASWAIGHPEKLIDFGFRAVHETRTTARIIVRSFYGRDPERNYFAGCSDGGREALMEAQRYPEDFDGIIAGAPANDWSHLFTGFVWNEQALTGDPASAIPPAKLAAIQKAALAACDALDGVKDGLIEDPPQCSFDTAVLSCKGDDGSDCLTALRSPPCRRSMRVPKTRAPGNRSFPGILPEPRMRPVAGAVG
jgi:feruloyl esterase